MCDPTDLGDNKHVYAIGISSICCQQEVIFMIKIRPHLYPSTAPVYIRHSISVVICVLLLGYYQYSLTICVMILFIVDKSSILCSLI